MIINRAINPATLFAPSGFSHGVIPGRTVFLGSQAGLNKEMGIVPGGIIAQFRQAFSNVLATLREAGGQPEDLVSVTIYLVDVDDYMGNRTEIDRIWSEMAGTRYPAMAVLGVAGLCHDGALVEIQAIAVIPTMF